MNCLFYCCTNVQVLFISHLKEWAFRTKSVKIIEDEDTIGYHLYKVFKWI